MKGEKTAVAISGGVDSLATAFLLKKAGHSVMGLHFITGFEPPFAHLPESAPLATENNPALDPIRQIGEQVGIPIFFIDCRTVFRQTVIQYFIDSYRSGHTPNPCLFCNPRIKFGTLLKHARKQGAFRLATGHYARVEKDGNGRCHLYKGLDDRKDQSYFLAFLSQDQLQAACFPLGTHRKTDVKEMAAKNHLRPVSEQESQDVCFIQGKSYVDFLKKCGIQFKPGIITDQQGNRIGEHRGLHGFTVGQRRGINCPGPEPYYVLRLDIQQNRLLVGKKKDLLQTRCRLRDINWIQKPASFPLACRVRIRYQHREASAMVTPERSQTWLVTFEQPQLSITPGQGAVLYQDDEVIGGGWIQ